MYINVNRFYTKISLDLLRNQSLDKKNRFSISKCIFLLHQKTTAKLPFQYEIRFFKQPLDIFFNQKIWFLETQQVTVLGEGR